MRILIIEEETKIAGYLVQGLIESGYQAQYVNHGLEGLELLKKKRFDLVILDVMLPDIDGWTVLQILRQFSQVPVIFLTAKDQIMDRVNGLKLGADDYITKPCDPEELVLRIKNILKRNQPVLDNSVKIGAYVFNRNYLTLSHNDEVFQLTEKEVELLNYFILTIIN